MKDIWFIGDQLMRDAYPFLQNLKSAFLHGETCYLMETYDVYGYYPSFTETNPLTMIRNSATDGFNAHLKMPNAIVIVSGTALLTQDPLFLPSELERKVRWIIKEILALIMTRKSQLLPKNFTFGEPRIIWVRTVQTHSGDPVATDTMLKFNNLLHRICSAKAIYTPDLELFNSTSMRCYDHHGRIIDNSFKEFWWAVSDVIKQIDSRDEQYFITKKVEERLRELKNEDEMTFERKASTYLAVTGARDFSEDASNRSRTPRKQQHQRSEYRSGRSRSHSHHSRHKEHDRRDDNYSYHRRDHRSRRN